MSDAVKRIQFLKKLYDISLDQAASSDGEVANLFSRQARRCYDEMIQASVEWKRRRDGEEYINWLIRIATDPLISGERSRQILAKAVRMVKEEGEAKKARSKKKRTPSRKKTPRRSGRV